MTEPGNEIILSFNPGSNSTNSEWVRAGRRQWYETVEGIEIMQHRHLTIALLVAALVLFLLAFAHLS